MSEVQKNKISHYYSLSPTRYVDVETIELKQDFNADDVMTLVLMIVMKESIDDGNDKCLRLIFSGLRNLKLSQPDLSLVSIPHLEILLGEDISGCTTAFFVRDPSQEKVISFSCADFSAVQK